MTEVETIVVGVIEIEAEVLAVDMTGIIEEICIDSATVECTVIIDTEVSITDTIGIVTTENIATNSVTDTTIGTFMVINFSLFKALQVTGFLLG
jgi:hypothetical protein